MHRAAGKITSNRCGRFVSRVGSLRLEESIRVTFLYFRKLGLGIVICVLAGSSAAQGVAQPQSTPSSSPSQSSSTPSRRTSESKPASKPPEFFDEPQFTVAGVTQATNSGGHGSDTVLRNSEALVKATVSLGADAEIKESRSKEPVAPKSFESKDAATNNPTETSRLQQERSGLEAQLLREDQARGDAAKGDKTRAEITDSATRLKQADLHHQLAQVDEKLGDPLQAVREYQRAAELTPSEANLFDWASELLTHRALEPATEVFTKGNYLYPQSVRMLIGLGVSWYARGSYDRGAECLGSASDLAPADSTPYVFMGKMQSAETVPSQATLERLERFWQLEPHNVLANYYYALSLWKWKQSESALDDASSAQVAALLNKAVELDPRLGAAYLQLGILYSQRGDSGNAIQAYQKAIEVSPELEEAHYRLAQAYKRTGDAVRAQQELQVYEHLAKQAKERTDRERAEIQEFVVTLRDK
jgi:tetratricopeptide (TPR) repeat protein